MGFISIFGNSKYINICTDSLVCGEDNQRFDDYSQIYRLDDAHVMTYTGNASDMEKVKKDASEQLQVASSYEDWLKEVTDGVAKIPYKNEREKIMVCLIGKMPNGLRMSSFSNNPDDQLDDLKLTDKGLKYMLLANFDDESGVVVGQLSESIKKYTDKSMKSRDVMLAQKELAQFVAETKPEYATTNLQTLTFK
ncbi:hypothetical protein OL233_10890 [Vagococcus sp. PNs007]|uniref:Uncharacterized protein n=1 Tax=Vagococcus proximus TaxID=2991417 RepID=A0ABT5X4C5_9ENTE|nr:hypothetical protein [Vagococcus proximus]MDF0480784.1 hypothetical protein [Vagococcus proximus]